MLQTRRQIYHRRRKSLRKVVDCTDDNRVQTR